MIIVCHFLTIPLMMSLRIMAQSATVAQVLDDSIEKWLERALDKNCSELGGLISWKIQMKYRRQWAITKRMLETMTLRVYQTGEERIRLLQFDKPLSSSYKEHSKKIFFCMSQYVQEDAYKITLLHKLPRAKYCSICSYNTKYTHISGSSDTPQ